MTVVVFKKVSEKDENAKTDYGVSGAFSSDEEAKAFIEKHKDEDKTVVYSTAKF